MLQEYYHRKPTRTGRLGSNIQFNPTNITKVLFGFPSQHDSISGWVVQQFTDPEISSIEQFFLTTNCESIDKHSFHFPVSERVVNLLEIGVVYSFPVKREN